MPPTTSPLPASRHRLVVRHRKLIGYTLSRYYRDYRREPYLWDALHCAATRGLIDAARRYDRSVAKFSTFAVWTIWGVTHKSLDKFLAQPPGFRSPVRDGDTIMRLSDSPITIATRAVARDPDPSDLAAVNEFRAALEDSLRFFNPTDRAILAEHLGLLGHPETPLYVIADRLGISRARAGQRFKRARVKLRAYCERFNRDAA